MDLTLIERGKPVIIIESSIYLWHNFTKEFVAQFTVIISVIVNEVHCHPRGCIEYISSYRKSRQQWLRKTIQQQELHHDQCGQQL